MLEYNKQYKHVKPDNISLSSNNILDELAF